MLSKTISFVINNYQWLAVLILTIITLYYARKAAQISLPELDLDDIGEEWDQERDEPKKLIVTNNGRGGAKEVIFIIHRAQLICLAKGPVSKSPGQNRIKVMRCEKTQKHHDGPSKVLRLVYKDANGVWRKFNGSALHFFRPSKWSNKEFESILFRLKET